MTHTVIGSASSFALQSVGSHLLPGERLFAFLDDVYVVCALLRAQPVACCLVGFRAHSNLRGEDAVVESSRVGALLGASISQLRHVWPQLVSGMEQKIFPNISARDLHSWHTVGPTRVRGLTAPGDG